MLDITKSAAESSLIAPSGSPSRPPNSTIGPTVRTLANTSPQKLSTLRRKGAELFPRSAFSSANAFEPDDFEVEGGVSPTMKGVPDSPVKSIWDADDDEFDHWPQHKDLQAAVNTFTIQRGTLRGTARPAMDELSDMEFDDANDAETHDEVMQQFYQRDCSALPPSSPPANMHLLASKAYLATEDPLAQNALPRLCDAVATVLYLTSPKCLADFLDPNIAVFEWRRNGNCLMIRRQGNEVVVGTFHNFGTCYIWTYFVRSEISSSGAWKEVYAGTAQTTTPLSAKGVEFEDFTTEESFEGVEPTDEKYALWLGRMLGRFLLGWSVWDFRSWRKWTVVWEADGVVTDARDYEYEALRAARGDED
ncbi:hypothetical protein CC86DRAFT_404488 [Ophiobolus disseminans]|uniref:Uncharacterized protein n=1 Tax=Ophiobolus disseminans TaxID=1469910 RepID=A0A6A7A7K6_9PLEO|nr:hypothetical protein CC86DRAFT_404488 [Ophiobolus disseminans]